MPASSYFVPAADAALQTERIAAPQLLAAAEAIAAAIPDNVPVNQGVARASYKTEASASEAGGHPAARVGIGSPFWHFLEYGTAYNPPYRPVQRAVEGLGLDYEPK